MAIDASDNLIVGTDPGGLVLRVSPAGEGFVLYQMPKREVTAVAVAPDGAIYAAAVGTKQPAHRSRCRLAVALPQPASARHRHRDVLRELPAPAAQRPATRRRRPPAATGG